jgi:hypothetical protein
MRMMISSRAPQMILVFDRCVPAFAP